MAREDKPLKKSDNFEEIACESCGNVKKNEQDEPSCFCHLVLTKKTKNKSVLTMLKKLEKEIMEKAKAQGVFH